MKSESPSQLEKNLELGTESKPYLVIHVGPTKTASTSLQMDLTRLNDTLVEDNWFYAGRYYRPICTYNMDNTTIKSINRSQSSLVDSFLSVFLRFLAFWPEKCGRMECMNAFAAELNKYKGRNVLVSDESIAFRGYRDPEAYRIIADMFTDEWNVLIVAGYRHFFQWLPSDLFQDQRLDMVGDKKIRKNAWPGLKKDGKSGKRMKTLFPDYYKNWHRYRHAFTTSIVKSLNNSLPVKILKLDEEDDDRSPQTRLVCDILPRAPASCQKMMELEQSHDTSVANKGGLPDVLHINYDILVVEAAEAGLVDMKRFDRKYLREEARAYNEDRFKQTPYDFDLTCPTSSQLEEFLGMSLQYERDIFGDEGASRDEEYHRAVFQDYVDRGAFCHIDAKATLKKEPWKTFFANYTPADASLASSDSLN